MAGKDGPKRIASGPRVRRHKENNSAVAGNKESREQDRLARLQRLRTHKNLRVINAGTQLWKFDKARQMRKEMTGAELRLWGAVKSRGLGPRCHRQKVIRGYIVDFYIPQWRLVIEVDGSSHDGKKEADSTRDINLKRVLGLKTLRFSNQEVFRNLDQVLTIIMAEGLAHIGSPPNPSQKFGGKCA